MFMECHASNYVGRDNMIKKICEGTSGQRIAKTRFLRNEAGVFLFSCFYTFVT